MAQKKISYNEAISEIEQILSKIESGDLNVDDLTKEVKRASFLLKTCQQKLKTTEKEVNKILDEMDSPEE